jgi:catechol 2,3-dioxygenase-like lactoylglutathione lyase family enzyme
MRINVTSVLVDDQDKTLRFYTEVLGFVRKTEIPLGEHSWLTVVSPEDPDGTELLLEPDEHPAARPFKQALVEDGIPFTSFAVDDVAATSALSLVACGSRNHRPRWAQSRRRCSTRLAGHLIQIAAQ